MSESKVRYVNPSPKARFQESADNQSKHRQMLDTREFQRAADYSFMEYCQQTASQIRDGNSAMAAGFRILGAAELLSTMQLLAEIPRPVSVVKSATLEESPTN
jgi:hypothetical protein